MHFSTLIYLNNHPLHVSRKVYLVGPYYAKISRCTVHRMSNLTQSVCDSAEYVTEEGIFNLLRTKKTEIYWWSLAFTLDLSLEQTSWHQMSLRSIVATTEKLLFQNASLRDQSQCWTMQRNWRMSRYNLQIR